MASRDKKDLFPTLVQSYELACTAYKAKYPNASQPFLTCTYRTIDEQNKLYEQGRTAKGQKVTNAKGGESAHNFNPSPAFDIGFITLNQTLDWDNKNFKNFAEIVKSITTSIEWGGDFKSIKDAPHFELKNWKLLVGKK